MKNMFRNILIASVVLSLNAAPIAVYAMPEPVPATQTDKQKAAAQKKKEAEKLKADLDEHIGEILDGAFTVEVLPSKPLSDSFLGETKKKYRIDKIINELKENADEHNIYIGITHKDICWKYKNGVTDWGVLGSSIADCHSCVVSDHRLKHKKRDLWKVVTHEFIHTYYHYPHCPKDSTHCLMKDAKGKADFSKKKDLCGYCKSRIG